MVSAQDLELKLQDLFKKKKYSEIISQITLKIKEEDRNAGLNVLLGISRMSKGLKDKNQVSLAVQDFKKWYLKEKKGVNGLNALTNFVLASSILSDFENTKVDFDEIKNYFSGRNDLNQFIILFSPGCSIFDQYKNFEERGAAFNQLINQALRVWFFHFHRF